MQEMVSTFFNPSKHVSQIAHLIICPLSLSLTHPSIWVGLRDKKQKQQQFLTHNVRLWA